MKLQQLLIITALSEWDNSADRIYIPPGTGINNSYYRPVVMDSEDEKDNYSFKTNDGMSQ